MSVRPNVHEHPTLGDKSTVAVHKSPSARGDLLPLALAAAAGALLAAIDLGTRSLWLDEGSTFAIVSQHGAALWRGIAHDGGNMLLYYLVMHVLVAWFGDAAWLMRLPSVIATAATGALVAATALRLFPGNRRLAGAAGLLAVVSLPLVYWGQNARGYAWLVTLSVASFLAFIAILQTPQGVRPSRSATAAYVVSTLAALYVGYDVALLIPAQLALLILRRERARLVIGCLALSALLSVPLLVLAVERGSGQLFWVTPLSWRIAGQATLALLSAAFVPNFHRTPTTVPTVIVMGAAVLAALTLAIRSVLSRSPTPTPAGSHGPDPARTAAQESAEPHDPDPARTAAQESAGSHDPDPARTATQEDAGPHDRARAIDATGQAAFGVLPILAWVLVPTVLTLLAYAIGEPIELPRVTILVMPPLALLLAWLLLRPQTRTALGLAGVVVLLALRLLQVIPSYGVSSEPWKAATAYVLRATPASTPACVVFYAQDGREPFDYYLRSLGGAAADPAPALRPLLPSLPWATVRPFVESYETLDPARQARVVSQCPRLWLITSHSGQSHGTHGSLVNLRRYQRLERELSARYRHTRARSFGWASPIIARLFW